MHWPRSALLAVSDANRRGNYTVLRQIAAPTFRNLDGAPTLDAERRLSLKGSYATEPNRIAFELVFGAVDGQWRLCGVSISTRPERKASGGPAAPAPR